MHGFCFEAQGQPLLPNLAVTPSSPGPTVTPIAKHGGKQLLLGRRHPIVLHGLGLAQHITISPVSSVVVLAAPPGSALLYTCAPDVWQGTANGS